MILFEKDPQPMNAHDIFTFIESHRDDIQRMGVSRLGLFGSYVRNEQNEDSDIDLIVEYRPVEKSFDRFIALIGYLESNLQKEVELVTREELSPFIKPHIEKEVRYARL